MKEFFEQHSFAYLIFLIAIFVFLNNTIGVSINEAWKNVLERRKKNKELNQRKEIRNKEVKD